jgi:hypothetical protein
MSVFVGAVHSDAFGLAASEVVRDSGVYEGQKADLHQKSGSMLEAAYKMDDCPTDAHVHGDKLIARKVKDRKKVTEKKRILVNRVNRLDKHRGSDAYSSYERRFNRIKQQVMMQNQQAGRGGGDRELNYNGEKFADHVLRHLSEEFPEVTDQDNVLEYLQELEDFEEGSNQDEIAACEKMLTRLEGSDDPKAQARMADISKKLQQLHDAIYFASAFRQTLASAQRTLRKSHGKEIEDGYNLIPKASDLLRGTLRIGGMEMSATEFAAIYRDKILSCNNFYEAMASIIDILMSRRGASAPAA